MSASWVDDGAVVAAQYCVGARSVFDVSIVEHPDDALRELSVNSHDHFAVAQDMVIVGPMDGEGYSLMYRSSQVGQYGHGLCLSVSSLIPCVFYSMLLNQSSVNTKHVTWYNVYGCGSH